MSEENDYGAIGIDDKVPLRFDLSLPKFIQAIEMRGYRLLWSCAAPCPCSSVNDQTDQVDPSCSICKGHGWLYFGPADYALDPTRVGKMTPLQSAVVASIDGSIIRGIMTDLASEDKPFQPIGHWMAGSSRVTVRPENRLGYYDRLIALDSEIVYTEVLTAGDPGLPLGARYPIIGVNLLRSLSRRYRGGDDFTLTANGQIQWVPASAPAPGTRIVAHYTTFPYWIVQDYPNATRNTLVFRKVKQADSPGGSPVALPIRAVVRYDFLPPPA